MKKFILLLALAYFFIPGNTMAQYSTSSFSGPWIMSPYADIYIIMDGTGIINAAGFAGDSLHPLGTDSVSANGAISITINLIPIDGGSMTFGGNLVNDTFATANIHGALDNIYKVTNRGALAGVWNGFVIDSVTLQQRNVQITIDSSGAVTSASGISLIEGNMFEARDTFAGYITTNDSICDLQFISMYGLYSGDSITSIKTNVGKDDLGPGCHYVGNAQFVRAPTGIKTVEPGIAFSVSPNPFTGLVELNVASTANNLITEVFDISGRKLYSQQWGSAQTAKLDLTYLSAGTYLLSLTADGKTATQLIVK